MAAAIKNTRAMLVPVAAYDTQRIREDFSESYGRETLSKLAVMGALSLYLSFLNLFQMLLQLLGQREE